MRCFICNTHYYFGGNSEPPEPCWCGGSVRRVEMLHPLIWGWEGFFSCWYKLVKFRGAAALFYLGERLVRGEENRVNGVERTDI